MAADRVQGARKALVHVANWQIMDEKHRKLEQIDDSVAFLAKICGNVFSNPTEEKYRKIKLTNPTFVRHVRDAPGGEAFMREAGWVVKVEKFERYWVFEGEPGSVEWEVLGEAVKELDKLAQLIADKQRRAQSDKKAETQRRLESVRAALEEDKQNRAVRFQAQLQAQSDLEQQQQQVRQQRANSPRQQLGSPRQQEQEQQR